MLKIGTITLFVVLTLTGIVSFSLVENLSYAKGKLGTLTIDVAESATVRNQIRNSFGSGPTSCIEGYSVSLENQSQDTMIKVGVIDIRNKNVDCETHTPMADIFKKRTLPLSVSGSKDLGTFGSLTIKINNQYYSSALKVQPEGSYLLINKANSIETTNPNLLLSYKNFYRVEGMVTARLYNAMVAGDYVDVKDFAFSCVFAANK